MAMPNPNTNVKDVEVARGGTNQIGNPTNQQTTLSCNPINEINIPTPKSESRRGSRRESGEEALIPNTSLKRRLNPSEHPWLVFGVIIIIVVVVGLVVFGAIMGTRDSHGNNDAAPDRAVSTLNPNHDEAY